MTLAAAAGVLSVSNPCRLALLLAYAAAYAEAGARPLSRAAVAITLGFLAVYGVITVLTGLGVRHTQPVAWRDWHRGIGVPKRARCRTTAGVRALPYGQGTGLIRYQPGHPQSSGVTGDSGPRLEDRAAYRVARGLRLGP